jgi:AcrR family transcriptional regulator
MATATDQAARHRERLTRARIVDAALRVMDAEGLAALTMRRVARELGVEAMSLYNHVRDKDDLLDGVRERILAGFPFPELDEDDWFETGRRIARAWRQLLRSHPDALELLAEKHETPTSTDALRPMELALEVLRNLGVPDREAMKVFHAFGGYIQGFVMMERQMQFGKGEEVGRMTAAISGEELPCVAAALPYLAENDPDEQFTFGLDLLFEGLRARIQDACAQPAAVQGA